MIRKQRGLTSVRNGSTNRKASGACAVCAASDPRALVSVDLANEPFVTLCGSHELMHRRSGFVARTVTELRSAVGDRRGTDRRGGPGEVDELAESLTRAFMRERRTLARRAS